MRLKKQTLKEKTINDTFKLIKMDKAPKHAVNLYLPTHGLAPKLGRINRRNYLKYIQDYHKWFYQEINAGNQSLLRSLEELINRWKLRQELYLVCDNPHDVSHFQVVIEYLSWEIWKRNLMPGVKFTMSVLEK